MVNGGSSIPCGERKSQAYKVKPIKMVLCVVGLILDQMGLTQINVSLFFKAFRVWAN